MISQTNSAPKTGVASVDAEHGMLFGILQAVSDSFDLNLGKEAVLNILDRLHEFTKAHFLTEETLMQLYDFPEYERHQKQHQGLLEQLEKFRMDFAEGWFVDSDQFVSNLREWFFQHASSADQTMGEYLKGCGVIGH